MTRPVSTLLGLGLALASGAACAQTATGQVTVTGGADRLCAIGAPRVQAGSSTNLGVVTGQTIDIAHLADSQTFSTRATSFDIDFTAECNFSHKVELSSDRGGLWRIATGQVASAFAEGVPYHAILEWDGAQSTLEATASSVVALDQTLEINAPAHGPLVVQFRVDPGATDKGAGAPLAAGTYQDTLTVTLGPQ